MPGLNMAGSRKVQHEGLAKEGDESDGTSSGKLRLASAIPHRCGETTAVTRSGAEADLAGSLQPRAAATATPRAGNVAPDKAVTGGGRSLDRSSTSSTEEIRADRRRASRVNSCSADSSASSNSSRDGERVRDAAEAAVAKTPGPAGSPEAPDAPQQRVLRPAKKLSEQEKLREQLQKLVNHKLSTLGDLDHAGMVALEALSKMPPTPSTSAVSGRAAPAQAQAAGGASVVRSHLPPGVHSVPKFSGADPRIITDTLNRFHALVVAALPGHSLEAVNKALLRDVVFVLEGSALKFFNALMDGRKEWEPVAPGAASDDDDEGQPAVPSSSSSGRRAQFKAPTSWRQVVEALHDEYLPAAGIARTATAILSLRQAPDESVGSLAARHMGLCHQLNRLLEQDGGKTSFWESMSIALFEQGLRADLRRLQHAEPPCSSLQKSLDRAERNETAILHPEKVTKLGVVRVAAHASSGKNGVGGDHLERQKKPAHARAPKATAPAAAAAAVEQQQQHQAPRFPSAETRSSKGLPAASADTEVEGGNVESSCVGRKQPKARTNGHLVTVKCEAAATTTTTTAAVVAAAADATAVAATGAESGPSGNHSSVIDTPPKSGCGGNNGGRDDHMALLSTDDGDTPPADGGDFGGGADLDDGGEFLSNMDGTDSASALPGDASWCRAERGRQRGGREKQNAGRCKEPNRQLGKRRKRSVLNERKRRWDLLEANSAPVDGGPPRQWQHCPPSQQDHGAAYFRPPCTLPQCRAINRQFHSASSCWYQEGKQQRGGQNRAAHPGRMGSRRPSNLNNQRETAAAAAAGSAAAAAVEFEGGHQGPPLDNDGFGGKQLL